MGEGRWSHSPRAVVLELVVDLLSSAGLAIYMFVHGHVLGEVVGVVFLLIAIVQAAVYAPRALDAVRRHSGRARWR
jgi:hypothetical protein